MIPLEDVEAIDWWGPKLSPQGRRLRMRMDRVDLTSGALDVLPGGRGPAVAPQFRTEVRSRQASTEKQSSSAADLAGGGEQ